MNQINNGWYQLRPPTLDMIFYNKAIKSLEEEWNEEEAKIYLRKAITLNPIRLKYWLTWNNIHYDDSSKHYPYFCMY